MINHIYKISYRFFYEAKYCFSNVYIENKYNKKIDIKLNKIERIISGRLMRINHTGEVCAQALYRAQMLVATNFIFKKKCYKICLEEHNHLLWCRQRLFELNTSPSYLNLLWYILSFIIGLTIGIFGDKYNNSFIMESEKKVVEHLIHHLNIIPTEDYISYNILKKMLLEELDHAIQAKNDGAVMLPSLIQCIMNFQSIIMTSLTYYI
jgi:ubiquinone biosynthesis monooxygenase Coq7